jgi:hypothetical protein
MTEPHHPTGSPWQRPEGEPAAPSWAPSPYPLPAAAVPPPAPPREAPRRPRPVLTALGIAVVAVVGMAAASAVAVLLVLWQADDVGERFGAGMGAELGRAQNEAFEESLAMEEDLYGSTGGWYGGPPPDQSEPVPPGDLGIDPVLDQYAQDCFTGDLQSCDDLFYQSTPFSEYERYGSTCGGRVKPFTVGFCTDLE